MISWTCPPSLNDSISHSRTSRFSPSPRRIKSIIILFNSSIRFSTSSCVFVQISIAFCMSSLSKNSPNVCSSLPNTGWILIKSRTLSPLGILLNMAFLVCIFLSARTSVSPNALCRLLETLPKLTRAIFVDFVSTTISEFVESIRDWIS